MTQREFEQRLAEAHEQLDHAVALSTRMDAALSRAKRALDDLGSTLANSEGLAQDNQALRETVAEHGAPISQQPLDRRAPAMEQEIAIEVESPPVSRIEYGAPPYAAAQLAPSTAPQTGGFNGFRGTTPAATAAWSGDVQGQPRAVPENRPVPADGEAAMVRRFNELLARSLADRIRPDPDAVLNALVAACGPPCKGSRRAAGIPGYLEVYLQDDQVLLFPPNNEIGDHTAYIGALFDLEKSLPSGSAIQVVQPARVALADLKYPPAPGMVRKGRIKLVG